MTKFFGLYFVVMFHAVSFAGTKAELDIQYYDIEAQSIAELVNEVKSKGPKAGLRDAWGLLRFDLNIEYYKSTTSLGCRLVLQDVYVVAQAVLPRWTESRQLSPKDQLWWQEFSEFIKNHEIRHFENSSIGVDYINKHMPNMSAKSKCSEAQQQFMTIKHEALDLIYQKDVALDREVRRLYASNDSLFRPIKANKTGVVFESGLMRSFIGM